MVSPQRAHFAQNQKYELNNLIKLIETFKRNCQSIPHRGIARTAPSGSHFPRRGPSFQLPGAAVSPEAWSSPSRSPLAQPGRDKTKIRSCWM